MKIEVASPCAERWDRMKGDNRSRFCGRCRLNVYNLSAMSRPEVDYLMIRTGGRLCVRFYRRQDGTVLLQDCPVGRARKLIRRALIVAGALLVGVIALVAAGSDGSRPTYPEWLQAMLDWFNPPKPPVLMGMPCVLPPPPPVGP